MNIPAAQRTEVLCALLEGCDAPAELIAMMRTQAKGRGAQMAINDLLSGTKDYTAWQRQRIDQILQARGLPSLTKLEGGFDKKLQSILARGSINSEAELYLVNEVLSGPDIDQLTATDREVLSRMIATYASKQRNA